MKDNIGRFTCDPLNRPTLSENGVGYLYYALTDHFDPWGNRMSYTAWNTPQTHTSFTFDRGFTGHEHYDCMHIINAKHKKIL